jgi:hypothetical protein
VSPQKDEQVVAQELLELLALTMFKVKKWQWTLADVDPYENTFQCPRFK